MMTGLVHDIDVYRAWARSVVDGVLDAPWERTDKADLLRREAGLD